MASAWFKSRLVRATANVAASESGEVAGLFAENLSGDATLGKVALLNRSLWVLALVESRCPAKLTHRHTLAWYKHERVFMLS